MATKYYVVWTGRKRGIFASWAECERQVKGYTGARYRGFDSRAEAEAALRSGPAAYAGRASSSGKWRLARVQPILPSICVDAACRGPEGPMEYRAVRTADGVQIFRRGPFQSGTNNVGEFLAIVEALEWNARQGSRLPIYSDSENAIAWAYGGACKTKLRRSTRTAALFELIERAEGWLAANRPPANSILKWVTSAWGENPADFGRK